MWRDILKGGDRRAANSVEIGFGVARDAMVSEQIRRRGIKDEAVLRAMRAIPRHEFVRAELRNRAYYDAPLPIGQEQTISQPYIVALMIESLELRGSERVLEVGTGCGYQAAVLSCVAREVHSVEVLSALANSAGQRLHQLGYANVTVHCGDGSKGLKEFAPYDAIVVAATAPNLPEPLLAQLSQGGRMIVPVGEGNKEALFYVRRNKNEFAIERRAACRFVPLVGDHGWRDL